METSKETGLTIGQLIQAQRKRLGMSMKKLAQKLGKCEKTISNWERDDNEFPVGMLLPLCHALRLTPAQILGVESDLDTAVKLQEAGKLCDAIRQITAYLRNIPDLTEARPLIAERDRLRHQMYELFKLPPLVGNGEAEVARTEQWKEEKKRIVGRYLQKFKVWRQRKGDVVISASLFAPLPSGGTA